MHGEGALYWSSLSDTGDALHYTLCRHQLRPLVIMTRQRYANMAQFCDDRMVSSVMTPRHGVISHDATG